MRHVVVKIAGPRHAGMELQRTGHRVAAALLDDRARAGGAARALARWRHGGGQEP
ncbi:hypothetical protein WMF31_26730 [Sorangium sp. So ce1036]|uniref:hypothetical protein n=1 Tax=Sorangium sp. So ce1036 TaxID=3133328 RepID=UPI003F01BEBE